MQYHTKSSGPDVAAFRAALAKAVSLATGSGVNEIIFLVHTLQMLDGGVFEEVLGERFVAAFAKNKVAAMSGVRTHLETEKIQSTCDRAVIFAPFVSSKLLAKVIGDHRSADVVYVPWAREELAAYTADHPTSVQI